jgi:hypothetical protein
MKIMEAAGRCLIERYASYSRSFNVELKGEIMINANDIHRVYEESPTGYWPMLKRGVSESPLTSLTVAAGAGLLAYALLKPKPKKRNAFIGKAAKAIGLSNARSSARRTLKSVVGSLALSYLTRKLNSKLRWR